MRYTSNRHEAIEIMNLGYYDFFTLKVNYDRQKPFKEWFANLMITTIINQFLMKSRNLILEDNEVETEFENDFDIANLGNIELVAMLQQLPERLRIIFNLYVIDNFSIQDICYALGTNESILNMQLFKARKLLKIMITSELDPADASVYHRNKINRNII